MNKSYFILGILYIIASLTILAEEPLPYFQPVWSYNGEKLLLTQEDCDGVYCWDKIQGSICKIAQGCGTGYKMNWSYNNTKIAFKLIQKTEDGNSIQIPVIFDTITQNLIHLAPGSYNCGVPFFSKDGKISFSLGNKIYVLNSEYSLIRAVTIGHYANLCVISPDGNWVAYNNEEDQICIFSVATLEKFVLTNDEHAYFSPIWSSDSSKILISTVTNIIKVIELSNKKIYTIGEGENPSWHSDTEIVYSKKIIEQEKILNSDLYQSDYTGTVQKALTQSTDYFESYTSYQAGSLAICDEKYRTIYIADSKNNIHNFNIQEMWPLVISSRIDENIRENSSPVFIPAQRIEEDRSTTVIANVPYIHQVYDTPDWYSGHWACGATSAMMAISYYGILPHWDCTVSVPYSHVSHYGRYVCEKYTYNGYTFNKMTTDPNGKAAYGGYGFICQNNWENTKSYMAEYFQKHGVSSSVDWSPNWSELKAKIDAKHPLVILNSLTSSGHYILGIGYYNAQHTVITNDPYGNKNKPGYPNYLGAKSSYDWPGYNNGFKNLNTVHCFIYAK